MPPEKRDPLSFKSAVLDLGGSLGVVLVSYGIPKNLRILDLLVDIAEESDKTFETDLTRMSPVFSDEIRGGREYGLSGTCQLWAGF